MGQQANQNTLNRFRDGDIRILITCKALDEGLDVPNVTIGIILSGTSMQRQRIQRLGRIIRKSEGKDKASLYYLHIAESTEDRLFLPDTGKYHILELTYSPDTHKFLNLGYEYASTKFLNDLICEETDQKKIAEAMRCLQLGSIRSDWLNKPDHLDLKIQEAKYTVDKNYCICMKKIATLSTAEPIE